MSKGPPLFRTPLRLVTLLGFGATASLVAIKSLGRGEKLSVDDGTRSAPVLPLDRETSKRDFQTATFGLG